MRAWVRACQWMGELAECMQFHSCCSFVCKLGWKFLHTTSKLMVCNSTTTMHWKRNYVDCKKLNVNSCAELTGNSLLYILHCSNRQIVTLSHKQRKLFTRFSFWMYSTISICMSISPVNFWFFSFSLKRFPFVEFTGFLRLLDECMQLQ